MKKHGGTDLLARGLIFWMVLCLISVVPTYASYENSTALGVEEEEQSFSLFNNFSYSVSSNLLDDSQETLLNQGISYGGTLFIKQQYYASLGIGASYQTVDGELVEYDNGVFRISDVSVGLGTKGFRLMKRNSDSVSLFTNLRNVFPLSERSQKEGYKSVPSASVDWAYQRGALGLVLSGRYTYVVNSFDADTRGVPNLESAASTGLTARYNWWRLRFQLSYRLGVLRYLDGTSLGSSGNSLSLSGSLTRSWWAAVSTSNFSNVEEQFVDLWFYDPFIRIYNLSTGVTF